ncbi:alpha/beta fold hydrolase [Paenibacillus glycanilyticus]|uniref:alpha/beta fold hydrolase n=1 Tax=Paenibacillus glycanilyticus TaxID=126569 RepID=UPI001910196D|nr:alpha/beta hydrolase [Paenibacillus glycanilyticus]
MSGELVNIRGSKLYVEQYGKGQSDALLYLHGGPGASCLDFCYHQAKALGQSIWVIAIDQRGVLRSDPLELGDSCTIDDLIEDCEALRNHLGIQQWSVLGHSFGGFLAFSYAYKYPDSIRKILYEAPCFDVKSSMESLINEAYHLSRNIKRNTAEEIGKVLQEKHSAKELWEALGLVFQTLGSRHKDSLYLHSIDPDDFNAIYKDPSVPEENWSRSRAHTASLVVEGRFFENLIPLFPSITQPSLLLHGQYDPVCADDQKTAFIEKTPWADIIVFENSAHFPRIEEADKYTRVVEQFILSHD